MAFTVYFISLVYWHNDIFIRTHTHTLAHTPTATLVQFFMLNYHIEWQITAWACQFNLMSGSSEIPICIRLAIIALFNAIHAPVHTNYVQALKPNSLVNKCGSAVLNEILCTVWPTHQHWLKVAVRQNDQDKMKLTERPNSSCCLFVWRPGKPFMCENWHFLIYSSENLTFFFFLNTTWFAFVCFLLRSKVLAF